MTKRLLLPATALAAVPSAAWAHGDHDGLHGLIHLLTEPLHLGILSLVGLGALLFGRWIVVFVRSWARRD